MSVSNAKEDGRPIAIAPAPAGTSSTTVKSDQSRVQPAMAYSCQTVSLDRALYIPRAFMDLVSASFLFVRSCTIIVVLETKN